MWLGVKPGVLSSVLPEKEKGKRKESAGIAKYLRKRGGKIALRCPALNFRGIYNTRILLGKMIRYLGFASK